MLNLAVAEPMELLSASEQLLSAQEQLLCNHSLEPPAVGTHAAVSIGNKVSVAPEKTMVAASPAWITVDHPLGTGTCSELYLELQLLI